MNNSPNSLQMLIEETNRSLENIDDTPFSKPAFERLKYKIVEYTAQLITESLKTANRHKTDDVSASHVEKASEYLISSTSHKVFKHFGTIGGLLLGAGLSNLLSMITTGQFNINGIVATVLLTIIGSFLVALHMARE